MISEDKRSQKFKGQSGVINGPAFYDNSPDCMKLLSLSKKSKRRIFTILASLKINNLRVIENHKMPRFRVFRQSRYFT